ncbi:MAG: DUF5395 family protein [Bacillota bacterium]
MRGLQIKARLFHDGRRWVATGDRFTAYGVTLEELGENVRRAVTAAGIYPPGTKVTVVLRFDYDTLPNAAWYRQYMPYYFDHLISFAVGR